MKKLAYPLVLTLAGLAATSVQAGATTSIAADETAIDMKGQTYGPVSLDVSQYTSSNGISLFLEAAGDYSYDGSDPDYFEGLVFKLDDFTIAEWNDGTEDFERMAHDGSNEAWNFYSFSKTFEQGTIIGDTTFGAIWESAAEDGIINISWANLGEVDDLTNPDATNLYDYVKYDISAPIPEPSTYALMLAGLGLVGFMARRKKTA